MTSLNKESKIARLEGLIGYIFRNKNNAWEALHAAGSPLAGTPDGNKRLALVGDAGLTSLIAKDTYVAGHSRAQTQATIERVGSNHHLGEVGNDLNIRTLINQNPAQRTSSDATIANPVEAIVGAVLVDLDESVDAFRMVLRNLGLWPEE